MKIALAYLTLLLITAPMFSQEQDDTLTPEEFTAG